MERRGGETQILKSESKLGQGVVALKGGNLYIYIQDLLQNFIGCNYHTQSSTLSFENKKNSLEMGGNDFYIGVASKKCPFFRNLPQKNAPRPPIPRIGPDTNKVFQVGLKGGGRRILLAGILTIQCFCDVGQHSLNIY